METAYNIAIKAESLPIAQGVSPGSNAAPL